MKILVFSDSHTDVDTMAAVVHDIKPDTILHLGDHIVDALALQNRYQHIPVEYVKGNTDKTDEYPLEKIITLGTATVFMAHGHTYEVQFGLNQIIDEGIACGADIVLFGHTHHAYVDCKEGLWVMNPGRVGCISSKHIEATYGIIDIDNSGAVQCAIKDYLSKILY